MADRRFTTAGEAWRELQDGYSAWSDKLDKRGIETAFAIIAANWVVYLDADAIQANWAAKWSIGVAVIFLASNLVITWLIAEELCGRVDHANQDLDAWRKEFEEAGQQSSEWPYTRSLRRRGILLRGLRLGAPLVAGGLFLIGLFIGPSDA